MIRGVEHVAIASTNPHKLAEWYACHLGFHVASEAPDAVFIKAPDGSMLEVIAAEAELRPPQLKDSGLRHLAITVDDVGEEYKRLKAEGIVFESEPIQGRTASVVFFRDPEGNYLHLIHRVNPLT